MNEQTLIKKNYEIWTKDPFDKKTISKVRHLKKFNSEDFNDSFYKDLTFGTGGMRGIVGLGPNRVNKFTFGRNTQGISNYILKKFNRKSNSVVIAFDCRNQSEFLAKKVAEIFSANKIKVFLFNSLRPTPELSYALIKLKCVCGIVITASHNPSNYNGYKVYWQDGGQIVPPIDSRLIKEINNINFFDIKFKGNKNLIKIIGKKIDDDFVKDCINNGKIGNSIRDNYKIVFTSLHGASYLIGPKVLKKAGYTQLKIVKEQAKPDGNFPTVKSPNPEDEEALKMAKNLAKMNNSDIFIGTDPDSDRLGIGYRTKSGEYMILNGNQTMILLTEFLLSKYKTDLNQSYFIGSTVVSTPMIKNLAKAYNVDLKIGLTGFKWIAKMIYDHPNQKFIGGGEESYGYLVGDFVRDKDAVTSSLLACELGSECKSKNIDVKEYLINCYIKYGFFKEKLISLEKKGVKGNKEIKSIIENLRNNPAKELAGSEVILIQDFQKSEQIKCKSQKKIILNFPKSNLLIFESEDGSRVAVRPSGTEPKIKFYFSVNMKLRSKEKYERANSILEKKMDCLISEFKF